MRHLRSLLIPLLGGALLAGGLPLHALGTLYSPDQINQMVAPIALYPDALMSQVLMAATYPNQVIETDQWVQANRGLTGGPLDQALATASWDPSVIALCKFPTVLDRMAQNISWTTDLGNAFLSQQVAVMDAVQTLRNAAYQNGSLRTTPQERVVMQGPDIVIQPYTPDVIYVPTYQPAVVYGSYWNYPSYYYPDVWAPWPGYSFVNGFAWGIGFGLSNILFGGCDWHNHNVYMDNAVLMNNPIYHNTPYYRNGYGRGGYDRQPWEHHIDRVNDARGGTGAPYGGRNNGRINGVTAGNIVRRTEPAALNGSRSDAARGDTRLAQRDATNFTPRGANRPAAREPINYSEQGRNRQTAQGASNNPARGANRPTMNSPTNYSARGANRPAMRPPTGNARPGYDRPAVRPSTSNARASYNQPNSRPAMRSPVGHASGGHAGGAGRLSATPRGGQRAHKQR